MTTHSRRAVLAAGAVSLTSGCTTLTQTMNFRNRTTVSVDLAAESEYISEVSAEYSDGFLLGDGVIVETTLDYSELESPAYAIHYVDGEQAEVDDLGTGVTQFAEILSAQQLRESESTAIGLATDGNFEFGVLYDATLLERTPITFEFTEAEA
jgi:hypothetical protein